MKTFRETDFYKSLHPFWRKVKAIWILWKSRRTDYFHPRELAQINCMFLGEEYSAKHGNFCFGNERVLKRHFRNTFHNDCMIEHGVYFGNYVISEEVEDENVRCIYTYSNYRKNALISFYGKEIKPIQIVGPYIRFAKNFKSKKALNSIKRKIGKTLLVFPVHGYPGATFKYDLPAFMIFLEKMAQDYQTVLVSLNRYDMSQGNDIPFREKGYIIVSSGNRTDQFFLNRQRDLIELSDMTVSNDIGTHIGYCICLGKPHCIFKQDIHKVSNDGKSIEQTPRELIFQKEREELYSAFSSPHPIITQTQLEITHKFWGPF